MKRSVIAMVLVSLSFLMTSCYSKSLDATKTTFKSFFEKTTYSEIPDDDIISVTVKEQIGTGELLDVEYYYGVNVRHNYYYRDSSGKNVQVFDSEYRRENGYPQAKGYVYEIDNNGNVSFDLLGYVFIMVFGFSLVGWFFTKFILS